MNGTGPKGAHFAWARLDGASHPETPFYGVETNVPLERRQLVADDLGLLGRPAGNLVRL